LNAYGLSAPRLAESLPTMYEGKEILWNVPEVAWAALALTGSRNWLKQRNREAR